MWWAAAAFLVAAVGLAPQVGAQLSLWIGAAAAAVAYLIDVQLHPWTACWKCSGDSKVRDQKGSSWRYCIVCGGSGKRRRLFARRER